MTMLFCIAESEIKVIHTYIHTYSNFTTTASSLSTLQPQHLLLSQPYNDSFFSPILTTTASYSPPTLQPQLLLTHPYTYSFFSLNLSRTASSHSNVQPELLLIQPYNHIFFFSPTITTTASFTTTLLIRQLLCGCKFG